MAPWENLIRPPPSPHNLINANLMVAVTVQEELRVKWLSITCLGRCGTFDKIGNLLANRTPACDVRANALKLSTILCHQFGTCLCFQFRIQSQIAFWLEKERRLQNVEPGLCQQFETFWWWSARLSPLHCQCCNRSDGSLWTMWVSGKPTDSSC